MSFRLIFISFAEYQKTVKMRDLKIHTFLLLLATLLPAVTHAYDFKQGNLYYKILSEEELTVATAENNDIRNPTYSGDIDIPSYVTYNGKRYTVTEIGGFANSPNVTSVTIPETAVKVTHFYGGSTGSQGSGWMIKAVTGPGGNSSQTNDGVSSLKEIRFNAVNCTWCGFYSPGMPGLDRITSWSYPFPPSVERIVIGSKVTRLPEYAFYLCTKVKTLTIPASVTEIGRNIIKTESTDPVCQLSALNIYSSDLNCQWTLKDPSIINWKTTTFTAGMAKLLGNPKDLIIPEGFTSVKKATFKDSYINSVTFPSTMTEICDSAFVESRIKSITFKEPFNLKKIGSSAFRLCYNLTSVNLPTTLNEIGENAFFQCWKLEEMTIPNSVNIIGNHAFAGSFTEAGCLKSLTISDGATPLTVEGYMEADNIYIGRNIRVKDGSTPTIYTYSITFGDNVTELGGIRFSGYLKTVKLPNHLTTIGDNTFLGCNNLTSIDIPSSLKSIGSYAFLGCDGLESITIPPSVQKLGYYVFDDNLQKLIIADGEQPITVTAHELGDEYLNDIGSPQYAYIGRQINQEKIEGKEKRLFGGSFYNTQNIEIGNNITEIEANAFYCCTNLKSIILPEKLTRINEKAFCYCTSLESIVLPKSLKYIGSRAFAEDKAITQIILPDGLQEIGEYAFNGCGFVDVKIPNSVTNIGNAAFGSCSNLSNLIIEDGDNTLYADYLGSVRDLYLGRETIYKKTGYWSGFECENLEIGEKITEIPANAISRTSRLKTVKLPETITSIGNYAFSDCKNLVSINMPKSMTSIGDGAFYKCSNLSSINLPESITSIGDDAFSKCENLESIILPEQLAEIGWGTFSNCTSLKSISIPNSVTKINQQAFFGCSSLESLEIGKSVELIWARAFCECPSLTDISVYRSTPPEAPQFYTNNECTQFGYLLFDEEVYGRATLSVPEGSLAAYRDTEPWSKFFNIKESGIEDVIADGDAEAEVAERQYYGIDGRVLGDKMPTVPGHYIERLRYAGGKVTTNKIAVQ